MTGRTRWAAVYRLYGFDGSLLYVGCSIDPKKRAAVHGWGKPWGREIDKSRTVIMWFASLEEARDAEYAAILTESPRGNARPQKYGVTEESLRRQRRGIAGYARCAVEGCPDRATRRGQRWCSTHREYDRDTQVQIAASVGGVEDDGTEGAGSVDGFAGF